MGIWGSLENLWGPETEGITDAPGEALLSAQNQREQGHLGASVVSAVPEHQGPHPGVRPSWALEAGLDPLGQHRITSIVRSNKTGGKLTGDEGPSPQPRWESQLQHPTDRVGICTLCVEAEWPHPRYRAQFGGNCVYPQENVAEL